MSKNVYRLYIWIHNSESPYWSTSFHRSAALREGPGAHGGQGAEGVEAAVPPGVEQLEIELRHGQQVAEGGEEGDPHRGAACELAQVQPAGDRGLAAPEQSRRVPDAEGQADQGAEQVGVHGEIDQSLLPALLHIALPAVAEEGQGAQQHQNEYGQIQDKGKHELRLRHGGCPFPRRKPFSPLYSLKKPLSSKLGLWWNLQNLSRHTLYFCAFFVYDTHRKRGPAALPIS